METYGTYNGIKFLMDGSMELSFLVPHHEKSRLLASIDEITQAGLPTLEITAKKKRKKRSLDANDYLWVLCTKIAERLQDSKLSISKEEVYRKHIRLVGKYEPLALRADAVERFCETWQRNGTGWLTEVVDSALDGCKKVFAYYGSSTYDTKEMSRLIDSVIQDCAALGIETMTQAEMDSLLHEWGKKHERKS